MWVFDGFRSLFRRVDANAMEEAGDPGGIGRALAYVCQRQRYLGEALGDHGRGAEALDALKAALRQNSDQDLRPLLDDLDAAMKRAGDGLGIWDALEWPNQRGVQIAGISGGERYDPIYECPLGKCTGRRPRQGSRNPKCEITGKSMRYRGRR